MSAMFLVWVTVYVPFFFSFFFISILGFLASNDKKNSVAKPFLFHQVSVCVCDLLLLLFWAGFFSGGGLLLLLFCLFVVVVVVFCLFVLFFLLFWGVV